VSHTTNRRPVGRRLLAIASITLLFGPAFSAVQAKAVAPAFGRSEQPLGRTYSTWLGDWAKWAFGGPAATNPLLSLQACDQWVQPEPSTVWFLSANGPGTASVTCSVPAGVPIALSPGGIFDWQTPGDEARLTEYMKTFPSSVRKPTLSVDGIKVDASKYLVTSPVLTTKIVAPEFGPKAGPDKGDVVMQARGWMLVLKGLKAGRHKMVISDELADVDDAGNPVLVNGKQKWSLSRVNYTLNVGNGPAAVASATTPTTIALPSPAATTAAATAATAAAAPTSVAATAPAAGPVLFRDDFGDRQSGWLDDNGGGWTMGYADGKYSIAVEPGNGGHAGPGHKDQPNLRNSRTEIDVKLSNGDSAFVLHCYDASPEGTNTDNTGSNQEPEYVYIGLSPKVGLSAYASVSGGRRNLTGLRPNPGSFQEVNRVAVECTGEPGQPGNVRLWLNSALVFDASVPTMPKGDGIQFALEAMRGLPARADLTVDNLLVTGVNR
jgi:hypothetical protein